jgi:pterin-4a-carbinolamine dehydratase
MPNSIFLSYRRVDAQYATFAIADRLRWAFGPHDVFFDRGSLAAGTEWPDAIRRALESARVFLLVVGEQWLRTYDEWGRRRIDDPKDWVRREIEMALVEHERRQMVIIPVLLGKAALTEEALDESIRRVAAFQSKTIVESQWEEGLESLISTIADESGLQRAVQQGGRNPNGSPARPQRRQSTRTPMSDDAVRTAVEPLAQWHLRRGPHPWGVGGQAQEITKTYDFESFVEATAFMAYAATVIDGWKPPHHPRWENQWKALTVFFTTWDVDCRVTELDIDAAKKFDRLFRTWRLEQKREVGN